MEDRFQWDKEGMEIQMGERHMALSIVYNGLVEKGNRVLVVGRGSIA